MFDSRYDPSRQPGRDDETGTLPNIPDITAGQPPAANGPAAALLRSAVPEERPTHFIIRILWPATYSAVGQSAKMSDSRSAAVRLSDGESEIFGGFFAREYHNSLHKGGRQRFYVAHVRPGNVAKSIRIAIYVLHKYTWASMYTKCLYFYMA